MTNLTGKNCGFLGRSTFMMNKQKVFNPFAIAVLFLAFIICGCKTQQVHPTNDVTSVVSPSANPLENGAYLILREAATPQEARVANATLVLTYDRKSIAALPPASHS